MSLVLFGPRSPAEFPVSAQDGIAALGKAHTRSTPSLSSLPEAVIETVPIYVWLVGHCLLPILEGGMSAASFFHSSFLQGINVVMLWPVQFQKVPQVSKHLCPAKLQTGSDACCAYLPICPFIPSDSGMPRAVDSQKSLQPKTVNSCAPVRAVHLLQQVH